MLAKLQRVIPSAPFTQKPQAELLFRVCDQEIEPFFKAVSHELPLGCLRKEAHYVITLKRELIAKHVLAKEIKTLAKVVVGRAPSIRSIPLHQAWKHMRGDPETLKATLECYEAVVL